MPKSNLTKQSNAGSASKEDITKCKEDLAGLFSKKMQSFNDFDRCDLMTLLTATTMFIEVHRHASDAPKLSEIGHELAEKLLKRAEFADQSAFALADRITPVLKQLNYIGREMNGITTSINELKLKSSDADNEKLQETQRAQ